MRRENNKPKLCLYSVLCLSTFQRQGQGDNYYISPTTNTTQLLAHHIVFADHSELAVQEEEERRSTK